MFLDNCISTEHGWKSCLVEIITGSHQSECAKGRGQKNENSNTASACDGLSPTSCTID